VPTKVATCQICQREFAKLRFQTEHINICTRCVNTLNDFDEPAIYAQQRIREMLSRGMLKRATTEQNEADEQWKRTKAVLTLNNFEQAVDQAFPGWLNRLLAKPDNTTKNYKQMRAHRRGLLRLEEGRQWTYPGNWSDVARRIRSRDGYRCIDCGEASSALHVHHIIYLSKYGTNQQGNLVTLCRPCHEKEHGREFDIAEADDPESLAFLWWAIEHAPAIYGTTVTATTTATSTAAVAATYADTDINDRNAAGRTFTVYLQHQPGPVGGYKVPQVPGSTAGTNQAANWRQSPLPRLRNGLRAWCQ
jgi:5-methylcytosine-specific restriction endonuclease McrA